MKFLTNKLLDKLDRFLKYLLVHFLLALFVFGGLYVGCVTFSSCTPSGYKAGNPGTYGRVGYQPYEVPKSVTKLQRCKKH